VAETQDMHKTGLFEPEEDDFLLTCSLASGLWMVVVPYVEQFDVYYVDRYPDRRRRRLMQLYKECIRRQLALNGGGTHLSKNPTYCGRVETLIETFPDARFVVPMRNPNETIPSLLKMMQTTWTLQGRDEEVVERALHAIVEMSFDSYEHPIEVLDAHPEVRHSIVDYRDLVAYPGATLRRLYAELDLELTPATAAAFDSAGGGHETTHRYDLDEFGLDADLIRTRLAPFFDEYDWDTPGGQP
jgi:hypothetical protein